LSDFIADCSVKYCCDKIRDIGKNRIIFTVDIDSKDIEIYAIGARGDVSKK
jgi:mRNA-degrading endonuclease RelE of RelBE toxin-antitoxin system